VKSPFFPDTTREFKIDLFDALDLKILPCGFFLGQYKEGFVWTNWLEMVTTPVFLTVNSRLAQFGVPRELRQICQGYLVDLFVIRDGAE